MAFWSLLLIVATLVKCCSLFEFRPVFYAGACPKIPPSANFDENQLLNSWYATHYTSISFSGYNCMMGKITKTPEGVLYDAELYPASGQKETFSNMLNHTRTPGMYRVDYQMPGRDSALSAVQVFVLYDGRVLAWTCVDIPLLMMHFEFANVISRTPTTPEATLNAFKKYLKQYGSSLNGFSQTPNINCLLP